MRSKDEAEQQDPQEQLQLQVKNELSSSTNQSEQVFFTN